MADEILQQDDNSNNVAGAVTNDPSQEVRNLRMDDNSKGLLTFDSVSPLEIAKGNVAGHSHVSVIGRNPAVGTVFEDVWDGGIISTLAYDAQSANFTAGLVLTGGTSGATAIIVIDDDAGTTGILTIRKITGTFQNDETITDSGSGSATSNGTITNLLSQTLPTAGETWEIICESTDDDSTGTGARTVLITYLDSNHVQQTETVSLDGHTAVAMVAINAFRFISAAVLTWGSGTNGLYGKTNTGSIVIRDSSSNNIRGVITYDDAKPGDEHGFNNTQNGSYTVPAGKTAFITLIVTNVTKNHDVTLRSLARLDGVDGFSTLGEMGNYQNSFIESLVSSPAKVVEKTDFKFIARSNNTSVSVITQITITLIDN